MEGALESTAFPSLPERAWIATLRARFASMARSRPASLAAIVVAVLICTLPGLFTIPPIDRDETRAAVVARALAEGMPLASQGVATVGRENALGMEWLQAATLHLLGDSAASQIATYRVPAMLGAIAAALLTWWMALPLGSRRAALLSGLLIATSSIMAVEGRLAKSDTVLLAAIVLAQGALVRIWLAGDDAPRPGHVALFWTSLGAAVLLKGPVTVESSLFTVAVLTLAAGSTRWLGRLAPLYGLPWLALLSLPWIFRASASADGLGGALVSQLAPWLLARGVEGSPPGTFLLLSLASFWPALPLLALAVPWVLDRLNRPGVLFALAWAVPLWAVSEANPWKQPHDVLPAYPALALLAGLAIDSGGLRTRGTVRKALAATLVLVPAALLAGAVGIAVAPATSAVPLLGLAFLVAALVGGGAALRLLLRERSPLAAVAVVLGTAAVLYVAIFGMVGPALDFLRVTERAIAAARAAVACPAPMIVAAGYAEPSVVLVGGANTVLAGGAEAADFLAGGRCRVAIVEAGALDDFHSRAEDRGVGVTERGVIKGYNIGGSKWVSLSIFVPNLPAAGPQR